MPLWITAAQPSVLEQTLYYDNGAWDHPFGSTRMIDLFFHSTSVLEQALCYGIGAWEHAVGSARTVRSLGSICHVFSSRLSTTISVRRSMLKGSARMIDPLMIYMMTPVVSAIGPQLLPL